MPVTQLNRKFAEVSGLHLSYRTLLSLLLINQATWISATVVGFASGVLAIIIIGIMLSLLTLLRLIYLLRIGKDRWMEKARR